ncbi:MAG: hypothetical protein EZS28_052446, partial [Streblomastix strix]
MSGITYARTQVAAEDMRQQSGQTRGKERFRPKSPQLKGSDTRLQQSGSRGGYRSGQDDQDPFNKIQMNNSGRKGSDDHNSQGLSQGGSQNYQHEYEFDEEDAPKLLIDETPETPPLYQRGFSSFSGRQQQGYGYQEGMSDMDKDRELQANVERLKEQDNIILQLKSKLEKQNKLVQEYQQKLRDKERDFIKEREQEREREKDRDQLREQEINREVQKRMDKFERDRDDDGIQPNTFNR